MSMKLCGRLCLLGMLPLAAPAAGAVELARLPLFKALIAPAVTNSEIGSVALDREMYAVAEARFANFRLCDQEGRETPFWIRQKTHTQVWQRESVSAAEVVAFQELPDNRIAITLRRDPARPAPCALQFQTAMKNFEKLVTVSGSREGTDWQVLADQEPIYDYSRYLKVRNDRINLPPAEAGLYKVEIANITERKESPLVEIVRQTGGDRQAVQWAAGAFWREAFKIDQVRFVERQENQQAGEPETWEEAIADWGVDLNVPKKNSLITFATRRQPLIAVTVTAKEANFYRNLSVKGTDDSMGRTGWKNIAFGRISRIQAGRVHQQNLTVVFPSECRYRNYRLTIHNEDNPPLTITGIRVRGYLYEVLFFPQAERKYRLYYGGQGLESPRYDVAAVLAAVPAGKTEVWAAGAQTANPEFRETFRVRSGKKMFTLSLGLMVAVLVMLIIRTKRKVEALKKDW